MAVIAFTQSPLRLTSSIRNDISHSEIRTWEMDSDGDITHTAEQYRYLAWFHLRRKVDAVVFNIIGNKKHEMDEEVYGIYHGRLVEMLVAHYSHLVTGIRVTPGPTANDRV